MMMPRFSFAFIKIGDKVYAIGGGNSDPEGNLIVLDSCEYFDINKKVWSSMGSLTISLISPTAINVKGNLYIFGGID